MKINKKLLLILIAILFGLTSCDFSAYVPFEEISTDIEESTQISIPNNMILYPNPAIVNKELEPIKLDSDGEYSIIYYSCQPGTYHSSEGMGVFPGIHNFIDTEINTPVPTLKVGNKIFENVLHSHTTKEPDGKTVDYFVSSDKTTLISTVVDLEEYRIVPNYYGTTNRKLMDFPGSDITEESLSNFAISYISSFVEDIDYNEYTYYIDTCIYKKSEGEKDIRITKEGFYIPQNTEYIDGYKIGFAKHINGIRTGDQVMVNLNESGDITSLIYAKYNVDWDECEINFEKAKAKAQGFIEDNLNDDYELVSYKITSNGIGRVRRDKLGFVFSATVEYYAKDNPSYVTNTTVSIYLG